MESTDAIDSLAALAHDTRLKVFRLLVRAGPTGLPAGAVAAALGVAPSTLSHHLGLLERAGLVRGTRRQRQIVYAADFDGARDLLDFLMADCCQGRPEICAGLAVAAPCPPEMTRSCS